jgi:hypothetical protein
LHHRPFNPCSLLTEYRYKPEISFNDVVNTLAFDCDNGETFFTDEVIQRCHEFMVKHGAQHLIVQKDDKTTTFSTGKAGNIFEDAKRKTFGKVDIKGQI